jgi:hypothetical protein
MEMASAVERFSQALGHLQGTVEAMDNTVRAMAEQWRRQDEAATTGRKALYERFEALSIQVAQAVATLNFVKDEMEDLKVEIDQNVMPAVKAFNHSTSYQAGAAWMRKAIWGGIATAGTLAGYYGHAIYKYFSGPPGTWPH